MLFLPVLLFLWGVSPSNAEGRLRTFHLIQKKIIFSEALNACRRNFTDLVTIYDEKDYNDLVRVLNNDNTESVNAWIGAFSCKWTNGDLVTFSNLSRTFNKPDKKYCVAIKTSGSWEISDCNATKKYFICSDRDNETQSQNYTLITESRTWFDAQSYCRENHTDLVSIRDETENKRVKETLTGTNSFWIGLRFVNNSLDWFDGGHSNYTPDNTKSEGCFTYLSKSDSSWFKANLGENLALCYESLIHVSEYKMRWEAALDYCKIKASRLLCIHSLNDQSETERELKRRNISGPLWVGLRQSRKGGFQPENTDRCRAIEEENGEYKWSDKDCSSEFIAVCEK